MHPETNTDQGGTIRPDIETQAHQGIRENDTIATFIGINFLEAARRVVGGIRPAPWVVGSDNCCKTVIVVGASISRTRDMEYAGGDLQQQQGSNQLGVQGVGSPILCN